MTTRRVQEVIDEEVLDTLTNAQSSVAEIERRLLLQEQRLAELEKQQLD